MTTIHTSTVGSLASRYAAVRAATEALAAPLSAEDQQLQSMPDASPTKWHRAHTSWFFEELVLVPRGHAPHRPEYRFLFNSYYESVGPRHPRPSRGLISRPSSEEIAAYRRAVDDDMLHLLGGLDETSLGELRPIIELGLAHEEQHQELLLTDILHAFSQSPLLPAYRGTSRDVGARANERHSHGPPRFFEHPGGLHEIGTDGRAGFTFDNERPRHRVWVDPFAIAHRPISMAEVRAFIEAGGYDEPSLWLADGLEHARAHAIRAPLYARLDGGAWRGFTLEGEVDLEDDAPAAHLSFYEADALARFLGGRLPTEAEWEIVAASCPDDEGNFRETGALRPRASTSDAARPVQLFGDVWEWTSSPYQPYPGFAPAPGVASEYNGKFMVNQVVLRGGSCFTPRGHVRPTYRNFWYPHTRFQVSGARIVRAVAK